MSKKRLKVPHGFDAVAHIIVRAVDKKFIFHEAEIKKLHSLVREYARFCGIKILTFKYMTTHFHIVVVFPHRPDILPTDDELFELVKSLTSEDSVRQHMLEMFPVWKAENDQAGLQAFRDEYFPLMWNLSVFMKLIKQRFTAWYNPLHDRVGTLYEGPFDMDLVEGHGEALMVVANYNDNNGLRAGMVQDPKDDRWSGYSMALQGDPLAFAGIKEVVARFLCVPLEEVSDESVLPLYSYQLYSRAVEQRDINGTVTKKGMKPEDVRQILANLENTLKSLSKNHDQAPGAPVPHPLPTVESNTVPLKKVGAIGSKEFVELIYTHNRTKFGAKRKVAGYKISDSDLYVINRRNTRRRQPMGKT